MLIINMKKLNYLQEKYYYEGELFTGVAFRTNEEKIEDIYEFSQGDKISIYQNKYFPNHENLTHIDIDYIDFTGEYLDNFALYNNKRFSGIAYELEGEQEFCLGQHLIENGVTIASCCWYPSGEKESLRLDRDDIVKSFEWFKDSSIKKMSLYIRECRKTIINIMLNEPQKLTSVRIEDNYFDLITKYKPQLEYHYCESRNFFDNYSVNSTLSLINSGIDDLVFDSLAVNNGFEDLSSLILLNTSLTASSILKLANLENLTEVNFIEDKNDLLSIAKQLKSQKPNCLIKLNHQIITDTVIS